MKRFSFTDIFSLMVIFGSIFVFFLRLFWPTQQLIMTPDFGRSDIWHFSLATKFLLWDALKSNHLPLWTNLLGNGFPLFAEGQTGVFFLPNLIIYKIFPFVTAYNVSFIITLSTLGWGMYLWLRVRTFHWIIALFGSITLVFSGTVINQIPHITLLQSASVMPWILLSIEFLKQNPKSIYRMGLFALLLQQQVMTGFPQMVFLTLLLALSMLLWHVYQTKKKLLIISFCIAFLWGLLLSSIQLIPSYEFLKQSTNPNGFSQSAATFFSFPPNHLLTFINPFHFGSPKAGTYPPFTVFDGSIFWENIGYIGIVPVLLGFLSVVLLLLKQSKKKSSFYIFWIGVVVISFLFMLGKYSPLYVVYSFWPFSLFRVPSRFIWIFDVSIIFLACFSLQYISLKIQKRKTLLVLGAAIMVYHFFSIIGTWYDYHPYVSAIDWLTKPQALRTIGNDDRVFSIGTESAYNEFFLKSGWTDMQPYAFLRNALAPNSTVYWGIGHADVYAGRFLRRQSLFNDLLNTEISFESSIASVSSSGDKLFTILGITKLISPKEITRYASQTQSTLQSPYGSLWIYGLSSQTSTPYIANSIHKVTSLQEAKKQLQKDNFSAQKSALVEKDLSIEKNAVTVPIQVKKLSDTYFQIHVDNLAQHVLLVNPITYYPGWIATVDDKKTEIVPVNITQQGIVLENGTHNIVWQYKPFSFTVGAVVTCVFLSITVVLMVFHHFFWPFRTHQTTVALARHHRRNPSKSALRIK